MPTHPRSSAYITHPLCHEHDTGPHHPERPERLTTIRRALDHHGLDDRLAFLSAPAATRRQLERVHPAAYLDALEAAVPTQGRVWLDSDTPLSPGSWQAAVHAAGAVVAAVDAVLEGRHHHVFCAVRPPGHHAERRRAMGFCLLDNIAVGAAHALARGLTRLVILDFDVHHGNGSEDYVRTHPEILLCSAYQYPLYPYRPPQDCSGNVLCTALPAGSDGAAWFAAVEPVWEAALARHRPQLILVSSGFDAHRADPLAGLALDTADYRRLGARILHWAQEYRAGVVSVLEGGYALEALGESASAYIEALAGDDDQC